MSDINLENSTAKESRNTSLKKNASSNAANNLSVFVPHANPPQQARESYEEPGVLNGIEIRGPVRTEDIVDDTDPTVNLHEFFLEQLRESKDRMYLLQLEDQFISLIQDSPHTLHYQHVTSYHRMLIHRMATYFGLHHTLDDEGTGVNVTKIAKSRMPETRFCDLIPAPQEGDVCDKERVVILRRKYMEQPIRPNPQIIRPTSPPSSDSETKSIKQREENYAMVRARIFEGEGSEGEMGPLKPEDNLVPTEHSSFLPNSTDSLVPQESLSADPAPAPAAVPVPIITPLSRPKEETDLIHGSNNNKTHISNAANSNNRRRYDNNNKHSRGKNSFPNQPSHQTHFTPQLFVPSNIPYFQLGSFYPPQNEGGMPMYPVHRHPPPATHSSLPATLPLHHNLSILPTQNTIPINNQHFLSQSQRPDTSPFIPSPHMTNTPQPALQLPINPTAAAAVNPPLQYPASFPMVGLQPASTSLLQRTSNPAFHSMQPSSDVISYMSQVAPSCEPPKDDAYLYMPGYANQLGPAYAGVQWEQSAPGVLKLKPQPPSQQQLPHSLQQLTNSLEMMGMHGEEHMYLHPSSKHVSPGGDVYPGYSPYPTPNTVQGQGVYMQNNIAFLPYQQYQSQDASLLPHVNPMSSSRLVLPHPTPATASMSLPDSGYPLITPPLPVRSVVANISPAASLTNGQQFLPHPHGQMLQHTMLHSHLAVANQSLQEFQVNNHNFKNLKHSKSTELLFNQENSRYKLNRHQGSRSSADKSRHRVHHQGNQPIQHKQSGSIYIPPRSAADAHLQAGDKDGLLPTPATMRILEIFELKVSFEEAERCVREIAHVRVDFHSIRYPNTGQEVLLAIFESEQLTDILNKINSDPATKFKTRFPDQNLVKYLSSTILQPTASN